MAEALRLPSVGADAKDLEGRAKSDQEESCTLAPREFFWDSIVLFVLSAILGLTAIDVVSEFIRGSAVECYVPGGLLEENADGNHEYINSFCSRDLPPTQLFPAFIVVSGVLVAIPHYLWVNHYGGSFEFFFSLASTLERLRDKATGEYSEHNHLIVQQLETAFSTYKRNTVFWVYVGKLGLQWVFSVVGFGVAVAYFTDFEETFFCPDNVNNTFWPLDKQVICVFTSLRLIWLIRLAYIVLLILVILGLSWALFWCFCTHASELTSRETAQFAFYSGLPPEYYVAKLPVPGWCRPLRTLILKFVTTIPWFSRRGPRVHTDLDFMVMKLFRTDSGLGYVFRDVQIARETRRLIDDDQRRLNLHYRKHTSIELEDTPHDKDLSGRYLKWAFTKTKDDLGVYFDYQALQEDILPVPNILHGAILGFSARAPDNGSAISISFNSDGYATTLARVFQWVGSIHFSSYYNNPEHPVLTSHYHTNVVSVLCRENILASETDIHTKFVLKLKDLWVPPNQDLALDTGFVVVGPIDKELHLATVDLLLGQIAGCLLQGAVLLTVRPISIEGKDTGQQFLQYHPPDKSFVPLRQGVRVFTGRGPRQWGARASQQQSTSPTATQGNPRAPSPNTFTLSGIKCGDTKCTVEFVTYRYTNDPPAERPEFYTAQEEQEGEEGVPMQVCSKVTNEQRRS